MELAKKRGLSIPALAKEAGYAYSTVYNFATGRTPGSPDLIKRLGEVLKVKPEEITSEKELLTGDVAPLREDPPSYIVRRRVPVVGFVAGANVLSNRAFNYSDLAAQIEEEVETDSKDPNALGLIVEGDSMEPEYLAGDRIVVAPNAEPRNRDVVVARLKDEGSAWLKRFFRTGPEGKTIRLESTNPHYPPIVKELSEFRFIYPVVEMQRKARR